MQEKGILYNNNNSNKDDDDCDVAASLLLYDLREKSKRMRPGA